MRRRQVSYVSLLIVAAACLASAPASTAVPGGYGCGLDRAPRDGWYRVPPPGPGAWSFGIVGDDACVLVAASPGGTVARTTDGGRSWTTVTAHPSGLGRVFSEHLGGTVVVAEAAAPGAGVLVSLDGGRHFTTSQLPTGLPANVDPKAQVVAAATSTSGTLVVAKTPVSVSGTPVHVSGPPTLFTAPRGSTAFTGQPASAALSPVAVAYDTQSTALFVADDRPYPAGGIWLSTDDGATYTQSYGPNAVVSDVSVTPLPGGGRVVYAASNHGTYDSVDGGGGWGQEGSDPVAVIRPEWSKPGVMEALVGSPEVKVSRSPDSGLTFYISDPGPPASCRPAELSRTADAPSFFLLGCADGRAYRFLSSGADFSGSVPPAGGPPPPGSGGGGLFVGNPKQMPELETWPIGDVRPESGSIAFDGSTLYYGDTSSAGAFGSVVHRMNARTGKRLPTINPKQPVFALDVDRDRRTLFVQTPDSMYAGPLAGSRTKEIFQLAGNPFGVAYSWDPTMQAFWTFSHGSNDIYFFSRDGEPTGHCLWGSNSGNGFFTIGTSLVEGAAGIAAAGDGTAYVELEDDQTVLRVSRRCGVEALFQHANYSEVGMENDALTCDTNSFPQSAVWIRDGNKRTVTAYEIPGGYCPLPTKAAVTAPGLVGQASTSTVCAAFRLPWGPPVAGVDVALFVDSMPVASGRTDAGGRICGSYVPLVQHRPGTSLAGLKVVSGVFLGTRAYRASSATGRLRVEGVAPPALPPPPGAPAPVAHNPPPHEPLQQPEPHVQAAIRQAQQSQVQSQAQAQPASQANPNPVVVAQQQEQPQLAYVTEGWEQQQAAGESLMVRRRRTRNAPLPLLGLVAATMTACTAVALAYRPQRVPTRR